MLFFYPLEDIKDFPMVIITPSTVTPLQTTLDAIKTDIGDYHLDHKRWWQSSNNKQPLPVVPPRYGKAYPRIHYKVVKIISRQLSRQYEVYVGPGGPTELISYDGDIVIQGGAANPPPPPQPCGTEGVVFIDFSGTTDRGITTSLSPIDGQPSPPPPPGGAYTVFWRTNRGRGFISCSSGVLIITEEPTVRYGSYTVPADVYNPSTEQRTTMHDEFISDHLVTRLNYLSFIDSKVLRKGVGAAPDPQPTGAPLWKGAWDGDTTYQLSDIVSRNVGGVLRTFFCIRPGKNRTPETSPTWWERCDRPKTEIVCGVGVSATLSNPVTVSQFVAPTAGATGFQTYLFPGRSDIKPICQRPFDDSQTQRDWRAFADSYGLQVDGVAGFGNPPFLVGNPNFHSGTPVLFLTALGTAQRWNGVQNVITSQGLSVGDSDGIAQFLIRTSIYSQSQAVEITLEEVAAP